MSSMPRSSTTSKGRPDRLGSWSFEKKVKPGEEQNLTRNEWRRRKSFAFMTLTNMRDSFRRMSRFRIRSTAMGTGGGGARQEEEEEEEEISPRSLSLAGSPSLSFSPLSPEEEVVIPLVEVVVVDWEDIELIGWRE